MWVLGILLGFILFNPLRKLIHGEKKEIRPKYKNLYVGQGSNEFVYGLNEYDTKVEAEAKQNCPPGYRWHSAIHSREWVCKNLARV